MAEPAGAPVMNRRRVLEQVASSASTLLVLAIVLMANYLAFRHYERFDWTGEGMFTLSGKSNKVLADLDEQVHIYLFMSRSEGSFGTTDELLKRYQAASTQVVVHYVDPDREPAEFKLLSQRFGVGAGTLETGAAIADVAAVVTKGEKNWHISRDDLVGWDLNIGTDDGAEELNIKAEQALTGAIVQVISGRATKLCVATGHGERSLEPTQERNLASLQQGLKHDNLEWEKLATLGKKSIPKECDALLIVGPERAYSKEETETLSKYLKDGGNLLLALDPVIDHDVVKLTGFEEMALGFGVQIDRSLVLELNPERLRTPNTVEFLVTEFGDHDTTRPLANQAAVYMALARSVSATGANASAEVLLRASAQAYGETDVTQVMGSEEPKKSPEDIAGPVPLGVAVRVNFNPDKPVDGKTGGRVVVVGDSDWLDQVLLEAPELANYHLASAWIGWLSERDALIEIPPKKIRRGNIVFTQDGLWELLFKVGILIPGAALMFGVAVWLNRRA